MMHWLLRTRVGLLPALAMVVLLALTACDDDPTDVVIEPEVATLRLIVDGTDTVDVDRDTEVVTGGPIVIPVDESTPIAAEFLLENGAPDPVVTATTFRLDVISSDTAVVDFTRTSAFAGTLDGLQVGSVQVNFELFHLDEGHEEWRLPVDVDVQ